MPTTIIHGPDGSNKTSYAIHAYAIPALREGRTVVTNVRHFDSVERCEEAYGETFPPEAKIIPVPLNDEGYAKMARFFHWVPRGAMILMDEIQKIYPMRMKEHEFDCEPARPMMEGSDEVMRTASNAFDQHRHMKWIIVGCCLNIKQVSPFISNVVKYAYRHKDMDGFLFFGQGSFLRVEHTPISSGYSQSGILGREMKRIDKRVFNTYSSTIDGEYERSGKKFNIFQQPKLLLLGFLLLFAIIRFFGTQVSDPEPEEIDEVPIQNTDPVPFDSVVEADQEASSLSSDHVPDRVDNSSVSSTLAISLLNRVNYLVGHFANHIYFSDEQGKFYTHSDLMRHGLQIQVYGLNYATISYQGHTKAVFPPDHNYQDSQQSQTSNPFALAQ